MIETTISTLAPRAALDFFWHAQSVTFLHARSAAFARTLGAMYSSHAGSAMFQVREYTFGIRTNGLIAWIVIGLLAGWLAGHLTRGRGFGCIVDVILGLIGAVIGGWIFTRIGIGGVGFWWSLAAATVGAVLLVAIARLFAGGER
jgi:uncharacterized membrane protein YeaQ/YmgE (transglycosylase-associated protein family)